jgi:probable HAF family extracellular repeat protein
LNREDTMTTKPTVRGTRIPLVALGLPIAFFLEFAPAIEAQTVYPEAPPLGSSALGATKVASSPFIQLDAIGPGNADTRPTGVNDRGVVSGLYQTPDNHRHGFLWENGEFTLIDFGTLYTNVFQINNNGVFVGRYDTPGVAHGYVYDHGSLETIDYPGSLGFTVVTGIDDDGNIVGRYRGADKHNHGFSRFGGVYTTVDYPGATSIEAMTIDSKGRYIAGWYVDTEGRLHGFKLVAGVFTSFDAPDAQNTGSLAGAMGVNKHGDIVGIFSRATDPTLPCGCKGHGFILSDEGEYTVFDYPGATVTFNTDINKHGDIVGIFYTDSSFGHGFFAPAGSEGEETNEGHGDDR